MQSMKWVRVGILAGESQDGISYVGPRSGSVSQAEFFFSKPKVDSYLMGRSYN